MKEEQPKSGNDFEKLVTWIHQCLHEKAVITPNDKIRDIHSKRLRQIDISIRLKDGPTSFFGIVEVRDRSRPIGENYIEEISAKRESVGADAAFLVSASGFCETALEKARALNIRVFSHKEAVSSDWTQCLQLREISQILQSWGNVEFALLDETNHFLAFADSSIETIKTNPNAEIILDESGQPKLSIPALMKMAVNQNINFFFQGITLGMPPQRKTAVINLKASTTVSPIYFRDTSGQLRKLEKFGITSDFWLEVRKSPVRLSKYCNADSGEALAEVASATIDFGNGPLTLDLIAKFMGGHGKDGSQVLMRMQKQDLSE